MALPSAEALFGDALPEQGLLELCRRGDPEAFARLVSLNERMVYGLALRLLGDADEAQDLAQEVFLQVYRSLGRFEGRSSLKTWIYRIVVNQCRNRKRWWRRRRRERSLRFEELAARDEAQLAAPDANAPFALILGRERARRVQEALLKISFDHRAVLLLREVEEMSCEEIAATLGLAEGTVKSRLARAREALRRLLLPDLGPQAER
jgi:RNA polymerase sigma-70 factor (ECF subfamily)